MSKEEANGILSTNACFANHLYSFITSMSLKCAVQLGIADAIHSHGDKPITLSALSTALSISPRKSSSLHQLMRTLTHSGYFSYTDANEDGVCGYSLTPASQLLLENHPYSVKPYILFVLDPLLFGPWMGLSEWFTNKKEDDRVMAFEYSNGMALWECTGYRPELNRMMMDTMAGDSKMVASVLMSNEDAREVFEGVGTMVDVGGGVGEMAKAISEAFPLMKCVVLDLPHVVEGLQGTHNLTFICGDMFKAIPSADVLLLKWILHDWSDEYAVEILKQCKMAVSSKCDSEGGVRRKVVIIDAVVDEDPKGNHKKKETQLLYSMEMMMLFGAKERTKKEWEKLFLDAGFNGGFNIFPILGFRSLIELFP